MALESYWAAGGWVELTWMHPTKWIRRWHGWSKSGAPARSVQPNDRRSKNCSTNSQRHKESIANQRMISLLVYLFTQCPIVPCLTAIGTWYRGFCGYCTQTVHRIILCSIGWKLDVVTRMNPTVSLFAAFQRTRAKANKTKISLTSCLTYLQLPSNFLLVYIITTPTLRLHYVLSFLR